MSTINLNPGPEPKGILHLPTRIAQAQREKELAEFKAQCRFQPWYPNGEPKEGDQVPDVTALLAHHVPSSLLVGVPPQETQHRTEMVAIAMLLTGLEAME